MGLVGPWVSGRLSPIPGSTWVGRLREEHVPQQTEPQMRHAHDAATHRVVPALTSDQQTACGAVAAWARVSPLGAAHQSDQGLQLAHPGSPALLAQHGYSQCFHPYLGWIGEVRNSFRDFSMAPLGFLRCLYNTSEAPLRGFQGFLAPLRHLQGTSEAPLRAGGPSEAPLRQLSGL